MTKGREYKITQTGIPGIELRVLKGTDSQVPKSIVRSLLKKAKPFAVADLEIAAGVQLQKGLQPDILEFIQVIPGLRGIRSLPGNWDLLAYEKAQKPTYNNILLRESLGPILYPEIVGEELAVTITLPPNTINAGDLRQSLYDLFEKAGVPPKVIAKLFKIEPRLRVDDEKLEQFIEEGRVTLLPGAKTEYPPIWAIKVDTVKKLQKETKPEEKKKKAGIA